MDSYRKLEKISERLSHLEHLMAVASWDEAVNMPIGGGEARGAALAELSLLMHEMIISPEIGDLINEAESKIEKLDPWEKSNLREIKAGWISANAVPAEIVEKKSILGSRCQQAWREMRKDNNWKDFLPLFSEVVKVVRDEATARSEATGLGPYDSLMDGYEPGQRSENLDKVFDELKSFLPGFIKEVVEKQKSEAVILPNGPFPKESQKTLGLKIMEALGFDFNHGRLDVSHHPFCGGVPEDVRITTRYDENNFLESFMGVIHETGHACYEQGLPKKWLNQAVGSARGMGIHESQSLLFEMQVGRSREFLEFLSPLVMEQFPSEDMAVWEPENLLKINTRVEPGLIRVSADEATYPLHVILRYEIEKALIEGDLPVKDLPEVWNEKMQSYLGLSTQGNYKNGCMQDVHWTDGSFGYFPTYTLGAMNAAQIFWAAKQAHPNLMTEFRTGDFKNLRDWLEEHIWSKGSYFEIDDLMVAATGEALNSKYFISHLKGRYS